ncbi:hypothetical protein Desca_1015 [Desulfotomaculum nigrificans CO-1-SRB]|uniref:Uncharacterized protein n=1 Tax=Desulfotomaculum nigrificans (strain DSM 14880 / VKM B-2319 / CO-1-SRB) TaxID=868595 RepID=F6B2Q8_DESCC|nr:hypothetical protein [Desulfotomaculum nigrificans]AEF93887.1 hypothetical protein Desca_1015 [Desulfotomaculum nigrificans CO-1-SRB]
MQDFPTHLSATGEGLMASLGKPTRYHFETLEELRSYLENVGDGEVDFSAIPISGMAESFHYDGKGKVVTRLDDNKMFDNIEDFLCYAFQCDDEGYPHTEYVDVVSLS